jgi:hypothetical protein
MRIFLNRNQVKYSYFFLLLLFYLHAIHLNWNLFINQKKKGHKSTEYEVPTFSQTLYDLIAKLISYGSSNQKHFLTNKSFKIFINDFIGEFYAEKLFEKFFDKFLCDEKLLVYIKMLEDNLFNENSESKLDLLKNIDLSTKAKESILNKIPSNLFKFFILALL